MNDITPHYFNDGCTTNSIFLMLYHLRHNVTSQITIALITTWIVTFEIHWSCLPNWVPSPKRKLVIGRSNKWMCIRMVVKRDQLVIFVQNSSQLQGTPISTCINIVHIRRVGWRSNALHVQYFPFRRSSFLQLMRLQWAVTITLQHPNLTGCLNYQFKYEYIGWHRTNLGYINLYWYIG